MNASNAPLPQVMGVLNVTPDSFSDGGAYTREDAALQHGLSLLNEGADWLDIGGESTRPGADAVSAEEECARVLPVLKALHAARPSAVLSIDTTKARVAAAAIRAGASVVNDVSALGDPAMAKLCAEAGVRVVLMHRRGSPRTMQLDTNYADVVREVRDELAKRAEVALRAGVAADRIVVDPGIGFGKALEGNLQLIAAVPVFRALGYPVLIGASRKRFIGAITGVERAADRVAGSVGAALAAAARGADIVRVHDVAATRHALAVFTAVGRL